MCTHSSSRLCSCSEALPRQHVVTRPRVLIGGSTVSDLHFANRKEKKMDCPQLLMKVKWEHFYAFSRIDRLSVCFNSHALLDSVVFANNPGALELTVHIWPLGQNWEEHICAPGLLCNLPFLPSSRASWQLGWRNLPFSDRPDFQVTQLILP